MSSVGDRTDASAAIDESYPPLTPGWRLRYGSIFVGQTVSLAGSALTQFVLMWWITTSIGTVSSLAFAGVAALLPFAVLAPIGGVFADRYSRKLIMIAADAVSALCVCALIVLFALDMAAPWHVYLTMFIRSAMHAFQAPAAAASTAMLVPRDFMPRAAGLYQTCQGLINVAAPPLGALAMSELSLEAALAIDVLTAIVGIAPLLIYRIPQQVGSRPGASLLSDFKAGALWIWGRRGLRHLYMLLAGLMLVTMPSFTLVPLLVKEHFAGTAGQAALMQALSGVGMMIGGLTVVALAPRKHVRWVLISFAASAFALALMGLAPANAFGLAVGWWVVSGATFIVGNGPLMAVLQTTVPNQMQGRVLSILSMIMGLAAPAGLVLMMPVGELIGARWLLFLQGSLGACIVLAGFLSRPLLQLDDATPAATDIRK